jgi:hypothetical protein
MLCRRSWPRASGFWSFDALRAVHARATASTAAPCGAPAVPWRSFCRIQGTPVIPGRMAPPTSSGGRFNLRCAGLVAAAVSDW